jgi:hypothetical protein
MQHLEIGYNDILIMPTAERRFYLGLLVQSKQKEQEHYENAQSSKSNSKGSRQTKISGDALKSKIKTGQVPLN